MEKTEEQFKVLFTKELIKDIEFYHAGENYLAFNPDHQWVIEGGVEFIFETYSISLGWNSEMHLYELIEGDLDQILGEMDVYEMEIGTHPNIQKLKGQKIEDISFNWTWYQKMNEDLELTDEKTYIPQEIKITFEDGSLLQLATIIFKIKDKQIYNPVYDSQSTLLVTVDQPVEIKEVEEEV